MSSTPPDDARRRLNQVDRAARRRGKRRGARARQPQVVEEPPLLANESIDPLGYYRYTWAPPLDACGTEEWTPKAHPEVQKQAQMSYPHHLRVCGNRRGEYKAFGRDSS